MLPALYLMSRYNSSMPTDPNDYVTGHNRVRKVRGRPQRCEICETTDPDTRYDWANLTMQYGDPEDYVRMCRKCHLRFDNERGRPGREAKERSDRERAIARMKEVAAMTPEQVTAEILDRLPMWAVTHKPM